LIGHRYEKTISDKELENDQLKKQINMLSGRNDDIVHSFSKDIGFINLELEKDKTAHGLQQTEVDFNRLRKT
jgi:hypothetical protein